MQELLWILAEIADHEAHVAGKTRHVVVERGIAEEFAGRALIRIEFCRGVAHVCGGVAKIVVGRVIGGKLIYDPSIADSVKGLSDKGNALLNDIRDAWVVDQFTDRAFLIVNGGQHIVNL